MDSSFVKSEHSFKSRSSISSRSVRGTNPTTPESDCARQRNAMAKLKQYEVLIEGYKKFLAYQKTINDESGFASETMRNLKATEEAKDLLVSELWTMPP
ncbi:hypothetical protein TNIN_145821 [Trichonephila inaurata madagascariensis]|uniref:Uncharacterized protein n=1 Tax=Trichonephila inaurata madagascariensis TaxID=2747483 RepID=A0A8X6Y6U6_9ARAC|nr:hypothetical protein TNIN_145821 [Trichonephila inaurata madagascariensis]